MSRERLEEIKMLWEQNNDVCFPDDYEWLIKQAERVEMLEEYKQEYLELNKDFVDLAMDNERYREALEFYARKYNYAYNKWDDRSPNVNIDDGKIARKALEGEK